MAYVRTGYPKDISDVARKRVADLLSIGTLQTTSLEVILRSAYLQGLVDAIETLSPSDEEKTEE